MLLSAESRPVCAAFYQRSFRFALWNGNESQALHWICGLSNGGFFTQLWFRTRATAGAAHFRQAAAHRVEVQQRSGVSRR